MRLGLRERVVALLALVSALTLAVAAVALLSPLDHRLRDDARELAHATGPRRARRLHGAPASASCGGSPRLLAATRPCAGPAPRSPSSTAPAACWSAPTPTPTSPSATPRATRPADRLSGRRRHRRGSRGRGATSPFEVDGDPLVVAAHGRSTTSGRDRRRPARVRCVAARRRAARGRAVGVADRGAAPAGGSGACATPPSASRSVGPVAEFRPESGRDEIGDLSRTFAYMQTRLREQEQARRAFVATASHELRTPVGVAAGDARPADRRPRRRTGSTLDDARQQARRADEQAAGSRSWPAICSTSAGIDAGVAAARRAGRARRGAAVGRRPSSRSALAERRLARSTSRASTRWAVGDPGSVAQILRILLDNALRHHRRRPAVVASRIVRGRAGPVIAVHDHGPGVAAEERERIFERFARGARRDRRRLRPRPRDRARAGPPHGRGPRARRRAPGRALRAVAPPAPAAID